jgi:hypothetical protein
MPIPQLTLPTGRKAHLGRSRPLAIVRLGRVVFIMLESRRARMVADLGAYFRPARSATPAGDVTHWGDKAGQVLHQTLDNTAAGDCVIASILKRIGASMVNAGTGPGMSSDAEALAQYHAICGPGDNGCFITDVLDYAIATGMKIAGQVHKLDDYVFLDTTNPDLVTAAIADLGPNVNLGLNLPGSWANAVNGDGYVWDNTNDRSVGGHDVPCTDRVAGGVASATWGYVGTITDRALANKQIVEEAYVSLAQDWYGNGGVSPSGLDKTALKADLVLIGQGKVPPSPGPIPPGPGPGPSPGPGALVGTITLPETVLQIRLDPAGVADLAGKTLDVQSFLSCVVSCLAGS